MRGGADLRHAARGAFDRVGPDGLDRIDDDKARRLGLERGQDVAQRGGRGQPDRRVGQAKALRPHADLRAGLFARDIDGFQPGLGKTRGRLQQKRRLPDPRIAAHEDRAGRYKAAAQYAVKLGNIGAGPRGRGLIRRKIAERNGRAALCAEGFRFRTGGQRGLFDDGIPFAAAVATPGPARMDRAAGCAGEGARFCHAVGDARCGAGGQTRIWRIRRPCRRGCVFRSGYQGQSRRGCRR